MVTKVSIGAIQPLVIKWLSFLFTVGICALVAVVFLASGKSGYWFGLVLVGLMLAYSYFKTLHTANIYVCDSHFLIEHAVKGTIRKDAGLYRHIESAYFYYRVVFSDGSHYYFFPSLKGLWQDFTKDSQGYSTYVRTIIGNAPTT